jgi:hypothetical protein
MYTPRLHSTTPLAFVLPVLLLGSTHVLNAQDFTLRLGENGREPFESFFPSEAVAGLKGGFYFGLNTSATYDSNFYLTDDYSQSELTAVVAPWASYRSDPEGGARFSLEASYSPVFSAYVENTDLNGVDHSGRVALNYDGGRASGTLYADYAEVSSADRLTGGFVEASILNYGIKGSYELGPRTTLYAAWDASMSDYQTAGETGADVYSGELAGLWEASERLRIGPALRYSVTESDTTGTRDALSVLMKVRYKSGQRLTFAGSGGLEFEKNSRSGGDWDPSLTGGLSADYLLNDRWTFRSALRYATVPSPNNVNYQVNDLSFTASMIRQFDRASLEFGLGWSFSDYEEVGVVVANQQDDEYFTAYLAYRRQIFSDRLSFDTSVRCSTNDGQKNWTQWQISTGLRLEY